MLTQQLRSSTYLDTMRHMMEREKAAGQALQEQRIPGTYQKHIPSAYLVVDFPGESMRCVVKKNITPDSVLIYVDSMPMIKTHGFEFEKTYGARRRSREGRDIWVAQKDAEFLEEHERTLEDELAELPVKKATSPAKVKKKVVK